MQAPRLGHGSASIRNLGGIGGYGGSAGMRGLSRMRSLGGSASMRGLGGSGGYGDDMGEIRSIGRGGYGDMGEIRSIGRGGFGGRGYSDSDGPFKSAHDKDSTTFGHENGRFGGTEHGEKDHHGGDDIRRIQRPAIGRYGRDFDSDGPMVSQQDRDFEDRRHENGPRGTVDHGEKDGHDGDRDDPDKGFEGTGIRPGYYGDNFDSDGPDRSAHDKDMDTYGHENGVLDRTEFGEKNHHGGDDRRRGFGLRGGYGAGVGGLSRGGRISFGGRGGYGGLSRGAPVGFGRGGHSIGLRQNAGP